MQNTPMSRLPKDIVKLIFYSICINMRALNEATLSDKHGFIRAVSGIAFGESILKFGQSVT